MSDLKVEVVQIDEVLAHPRPTVTRLELARIAGWECVIGKGQFKTGDLAVYVPEGAVMPPDLMDKVFKNSKIVPDKGRIRAIRIQGHLSQGVLIVPETVGVNAPVGTDVAEKLGVYKYEPPVRESPQYAAGGGQKKKKTKQNANFREYTKIQNVKWFNKVVREEGAPEDAPKVFVNTLFANGEEVVMTEKVHGSNFRAGYLPKEDGLWRKFLKLVRVLPKDDVQYEFVLGSHYKQLQGKYNGFYKDTVGDVYAEAVEKYDLVNKLKPGEVVYGEVYGSGVQKNYHYGCENGERKLVLFDLQLNGQYQDQDVLEAFAKERGLEVVPTVYRGPFSTEALREATSGDSVLAPSQKIREGVVVRPVKETATAVGRKVLKSISPEYSLIPADEQTDWH